MVNNHLHLFTVGVKHHKIPFYVILFIYLFLIEL